MTGFLVLGISRGSSLQTKFDPNTMVLLSLDPVRDGYAPEKAQQAMENFFKESTLAALRELGAAISDSGTNAVPFTVHGSGKLPGGSVTFMHPLRARVAADFWRRSLAAAARGERIVLGVCDEGEVVATVTLDLATPDNQRHRAEIAKLMTRPAHRGRGHAEALMREAERRAVGLGRTLLTLDTAEEEGAAGLYDRLGYERAGRIPDYAQKPLGGLTATILYFKRIGA